MVFPLLVLGSPEAGEGGLDAKRPQMWFIYCPQLAVVGCFDMEEI
jgi:hypothetical protein